MEIKLAQPSDLQPPMPEKMERYLYTDREGNCNIGIIPS